ncbi:MAG: SoxR reducing system RseC family protein [Steroidobacteraceae bacterium]
MDARVRVLRIHDGRATLACEEPTACAGCAPGRGCGMRWLGGDARRQLVLPVPRVGDAVLEVGGTVTLSVADGDLLRSAARLYLPPFAGLLIGPLLARHLLQAGDELAALAAAIGLLAGWVVARAWVRATPPRVMVSRADEPGPAT